MKRYGMHIDIDRCNGCGACMVACAVENNIPPVLGANKHKNNTPNHNIFKRFKGDFYAIDPMLFSPAAVAVTAIDSGETFRAGAVSAELLDASFV